MQAHNAKANRRMRKRKPTSQELYYHKVHVSPDENVEEMGLISFAESFISCTVD